MAMFGWLQVSEALQLEEDEEANEERELTEVNEQVYVDSLSSFSLSPSPLSSLPLFPVLSIIHVHP